MIQNYFLKGNIRSIDSQLQGSFYTHFEKIEGFLNDQIIKGIIVNSVQYCFSDAETNPRNILLFGL